MSYSRWWFLEGNFHSNWIPNECRPPKTWSNLLVCCNRLQREDPSIWTMKVIARVRNHAVSVVIRVSKTCLHIGCLHNVHRMYDSWYALSQLIRSIVNIFELKDHDTINLYNSVLQPIFPVWRVYLLGRGVGRRQLIVGRFSYDLGRYKIRNHIVFLIIRTRFVVLYICLVFCREAVFALTFPLFLSYLFFWRNSERFHFFFVSFGFTYHLWNLFKWFEYRFTRLS